MRRDRGRPRYGRSSSFRAVSLRVRESRPGPCQSRVISAHFRLTTAGGSHSPDVLKSEGIFLSKTWIRVFGHYILVPYTSVWTRGKRGGRRQAGPRVARPLRARKKTSIFLKSIRPAHIQFNPHTFPTRTHLESGIVRIETANPKKARVPRGSDFDTYYSHSFPDFNAFLVG